MGDVRDENEDAYGRFSSQGESHWLFIVADGMGGHARGREASTTTVEAAAEVFFGEHSGTVPDRLRRAFHRANRRVHAASEADEDAGTRGTTATASALVEGEAYVAHVGDSRAYRYRPETGCQLTQDHTMVQELKRQGVLSEEEARTHPRRGHLTRAVGAKPTVEVDLIEAGALHPEDHFLLCTDGLQALPVGGPGARPDRQPLHRERACPSPNRDRAAHRDGVRGGRHPGRFNAGGAAGLAGGPASH